MASNTTQKAIEAARHCLQQAQTVACFSGAGLSAESGIATFRDEETDALWSRYDPMELASIDGFMRNPAMVTDWYNWRRSQLHEAKPNAGHRALAEQTELRQITQNVDNLLEKAGALPEQVLHLHGIIDANHCMHCDYTETDVGHTQPLRTCPNCNNGYIRPSVVWFGESLPELIWQESYRLCENIDVLLVVGTSASVYPAASLTDVARKQGATIITINPDPDNPTTISNSHIALQGKSGDILPLLLKGLTLRSQ